MKIFLSALALLLALEGALFAAFPEAMRQALAEMSQAPAQLLRKLGAAALLAAIALCLAARHF